MPRMPAPLTDSHRHTHTHPHTHTDTHTHTHTNTQTQKHAHARAHTHVPVKTFSRMPRIVGFSLDVWNSCRTFGNLSASSNALSWFMSIT